MMKKREIKEHEIIKAVIMYLIKKEKAKIKKVAIGKKYEKYIKNALRKCGVARVDIDEIGFKRAGPDIIAHLQFGQGRAIKHLKIEAKGGSYKYGIYTALGQMACDVDSPSSYYWFGLAFPQNWRPTIRKWLVTEKFDIKPIVKDTIKLYTKSGQGLYFYFVNESGKVTKETWKQTLLRRK